MSHSIMFVELSTDQNGASSPNNSHMIAYSPSNTSENSFSHHLSMHLEHTPVFMMFFETLVIHIKVSY